MPASPARAQMAELVDALASGASVRKDVEVRVLFWAPPTLSEHLISLIYLNFRLCPETFLGQKVRQNHGGCVEAKARR